MPFRFQASRAFLTYAQCPLSKDDILTALQQNRAFELAKWHIGREQHEDGNYHIHALLEFATKFNTRNPRAFDIGNYHPNIAPVKASKADLIRVYRYVEKEDEEPLSNWERPFKRTYKEIIDASNDPVNFINELTVDHARDVVLNLQRIEYYAAKKWKKDRTYVPDPDQAFVLPEMLELWKRDEFTKVCFFYCPSQARFARNLTLTLTLMRGFTMGYF